jgi:23S rRNA pseudouridine2604 synthase
MTVNRQRRFLLLLQISILCTTWCFQPNVGNSYSRRTSPILSLSQSSEPIRLNKVLKATLSRRQADKVIQEGRVSVNGETSYGCMVVPHKDVVELDGNTVQGWEKMNSLDDAATPAAGGLEYVKYWKPRGVICTTDRSIDYNIIDEITQYGGYRPKHRVYPVGRLDKDSSGLILLTSDGRLPNASLRKDQKQPKVYQVTVDRPLSEQDLDYLRDGIVITTVAQRDGNAKALTAKTKPCLVDLVSPYCCDITLMEGRNRQIRKMMDALGYKVFDLHRIEFGEITLSNLDRAGQWTRLNGKEMAWIEMMLTADI